MGVLTYAGIENEMLDALVANVTTNAPTSAAERLRAINSAYQMVWEISGGRLKRVASATAWTSAQSSTTGVASGILTDVGEIKTLWASLTSGSVGLETADVIVQPCEWSELQWFRGANGLPTYTIPKKYAAVKPATVTEGDKNKLELHWWPTVTGFYFPMAYVSQFVPMDGDSTDVPEVNDLESYDIAWIAALDLAPRLDRQELAPGIALKVSEGTRFALDRKLSAMLHGKQDAEARA